LNCLKVCFKEFQAGSLLDIHFRIHVSAKPFPCLLCKHRSTQKGNLKLHLRKHHNRDLSTEEDIKPDAGIWSKPEPGSVSELMIIGIFKGIFRGP